MIQTVHCNKNYLLHLLWHYSKLKKKLPEVINIVNNCCYYKIKQYLKCIYFKKQS